MKPDNTALEPGRGYHDIGGLEGEPIDWSVTEAKPWEKLSVVLGYALGPKAANVMRTDENRRAREEMGVELYNQCGYFERGTEAMRRVLLEKGLFTEQELEARMAQIGKRIAEEGR